MIPQQFSPTLLTLLPIILLTMHAYGKGEDNKGFYTSQTQDPSRHTWPPPPSSSPL